MALESILGHDRVQRQNRLVRMLRCCLGVVAYCAVHAPRSQCSTATETRTGRQLTHAVEADQLLWGPALT